MFCDNIYLQCLEGLHKSSRVGSSYIIAMVCVHRVPGLFIFYLAPEAIRKHSVSHRMVGSSRGLQWARPILPLEAIRKHSVSHRMVGSSRAVSKANPAPGSHSETFGELSDGGLVTWVSQQGLIIINFARLQVWRFFPRWCVQFLVQYSSKGEIQLTNLYQSAHCG